MNRRILHTVPAEFDKKTVKEFLSRFGYSHPVLVQLKKTPNSILRNGEWIYFHTQLNADDKLSVFIEETEVSENIVPSKLTFDIVYEDEDILVVNKPVNMPIHPSMNNYDNSLANALMHYYQSEDSPFVFRCINRLDKDTSGLTVIAKNPLSAAILYRDMTNHKIKRTYYALVEGHTKGNGTIDIGISRAPGSTIMRITDEEHGEKAITHYKTLCSFDTFSLVECHLETGRTHQIRVHMKHIGHPLLGDYIYNPSNQMMNRHALHGGKLDFVHPITKKELSFTAPFPPDFSNQLNLIKNV